jgi:hypothetical protein
MLLEAVAYQATASGLFGACSGLNCLLTGTAADCEHAGERQKGSA